MFKFICIAFAVLAVASAAPASVFFGNSPVVAEVAASAEAPAATAAYTAPFPYAAAPYTYAAAAPYAYAGAPAPYTYAAGYSAPYGAYSYGYAPFANGFQYAY